MIEQLQQIIKQVTEKEVTQNEQVSNDIIGGVAKETGDSLKEGFQSAISGGQMSDIMGLFGGNSGNSMLSNPIVQSIIGMLGGKLQKNLGLDSGVSNGLASGIIPTILGMVLGGKGGFNVTDLLSSLTGGKDDKGGSILDSLSKMGLDQNGDGKLGIDDALSAMKNGNIGDILGGMFKK